jgi:hypothetical protein
VLIEYKLYGNMGVIDVYTELKTIEVKVPIVFLGTVGFSLRRDRR